MADKEFDLVVIGGGPGGYVAAIRASQLGMKVACVEKRKTLGGTCLNVGCIPSKALLEFSHHYHDAKHNFVNYGIDIKESKVNLPKMMEQKENIISGLTSGIAGLFKKNKVTYVNGLATILNAGEVAIHTDANKADKIKAKKILIATGSKVVSLPNVEIDEESIVSSTGALSLKKIPKKMILIGGGIIGLELGSVWARLGAEVEVIEFMDRICPGMDKELARNFHRNLEKQGFKFRLNSKVLSAKKSKNNVIVEVESVKDQKKEKVSADVVLVAVGRQPYTESLGISEIGVKTNDRGFIEVDSKFATSVPNIHAIGDVVPGPMLAHKAEEEGVVCVEMMAGQSGHIDYNLIPSVVYTYPEVAWVGQTEGQLKEQKVEYNVGKFTMMANSRARATLSDEGMVKILACKKTDKLLGCHIIGREAGNLIHEAVVIMEFGGAAEDLARICHAHPTLNEAIKEAALAVDKRQIHS
jgi:dihydrolipoamide dehydrogenase